MLLRVSAVLPKLVGVAAGHRGGDTAGSAARAGTGAVSGVGLAAAVIAALGLLAVLLVGCGSTDAGTQARTPSQPLAPSPLAAAPPVTTPPVTTPPETGRDDPSQPGGGPTERMRAVFVGEPCVPAVDSAPRQAVNGLFLYCGPSAAGQPRWGVTSPQPRQLVVPAPGAECNAATDGDELLQDANGRPIACLRDHDGSFRWSDVS